MPSQPQTVRAQKGSLNGAGREEGRRARHCAGISLCVCSSLPLSLTVFRSLSVGASAHKFIKNFAKRHLSVMSCAPRRQCATHFNEFRAAFSSSPQALNLTVCLSLPLSHSLCLSLSLLSLILWPWSPHLVIGIPHADRNENATCFHFTFRHRRRHRPG